MIVFQHHAASSALCLYVHQFDAIALFLSASGWDRWKEDAPSRKDKKSLFHPDETTVLSSILSPYLIGGRSIDWWHHEAICSLCLEDRREMDRTFHRSCFSREWEWEEIRRGTDHSQWEGPTIVLPAQFRSFTLTSLDRQGCRVFSRTIWTFQKDIPWRNDIFHHSSNEFLVLRKICCDVKSSSWKKWWKGETQHSIVDALIDIFANVFGRVG